MGDNGRDEGVRSEDAGGDEYGRSHHPEGAGGPLRAVADRSKVVHADSFSVA